MNAPRDTSSQYSDTPNDPRTGSPTKPARGAGCVFHSGLTRTGPNNPLIDSFNLTADGSTMILREGPNIMAIKVPDIGNCGTGTITKLVSNAKDPFWSPAAYAMPPQVLGPGQEDPRQDHREARRIDHPPSNKLCITEFDDGLLSTRQSTATRISRASIPDVHPGEHRTSFTHTRAIL